VNFVLNNTYPQATRCMYKDGPFIERYFMFGQGEWRRTSDLS